MKSIINKQIEICNHYKRWQMPSEMEKIISKDDANEIFIGLVKYTRLLKKRAMKAVDEIFDNRYNT